MLANKDPPQILISAHCHIHSINAYLASPTSQVLSASHTAEEMENKTRKGNVHPAPCTMLGNLGEPGPFRLHSDKTPPLGLTRDHNRKSLSLKQHSREFPTFSRHCESRQENEGIQRERYCSKNQHWFTHTKNRFPLQ